MEWIELAIVGSAIAVGWAVAWHVELKHIKFLNKLLGFD
jgi:hypothetical protein